MAILRAQVVIPRDSGLPEDRVMNTFHFLTTSGDQVPIATAIAAKLSDVYLVANPGTANSLQALMAGDLGTTLSITFYNLDDPEPRVPIYTETFGFSPGSSSLPAEVALCGSFQAEKVSGLNQANRRGRVYFGPFANNANIITSAGAPNVGTNGVAQTIQSALLELANESQAAATWSWAIYSPTLDTASVVHDGWVDNAFDTQRRRGAAATARLLYSL